MSLAFIVLSCNRTQKCATEGQTEGHTDEIIYVRFRRYVCISFANFLVCDLKKKKKKNKKNDFLTSLTPSHPPRTTPIHFSTVIYAPVYDYITLYNLMIFIHFIVTDSVICLERNKIISVHGLKKNRFIKKKLVKSSI